MVANFYVLVCRGGQDWSPGVIRRVGAGYLPIEGVILVEIL
jgi:hypothetical protein